MDGSPVDMGAPDAGGTATANPRAAQTRIRSASASRAGGQRAHDLRIGPKPDYVDAERSPLNRVLMKPQTGAELRRESGRRRDQRDTVRAMKSNAGVAVTGIITFGHEAQIVFEGLDADAQDAAYRELAEMVAARLDTDLTGLVVHCDESAPHAHFQLTGYDWLGNPVSDQTKRAALRDVQDLTAEVMGRHAPGIERGFSKIDRLKGGAKPSEVVNLSVAELHDRLPADLAAKRAGIAVELEGARAEADAEIERLGAEAEAARGKLAKNTRLAEDARQKTQGEDERAEKARKRLDAYERRSEAAREALRGLEAEMEGLRDGLATREADLEAREAAAATREAALVHREKELVTEAVWTAHAMDSLRVALDRAMDGRHLEEITAEDMAHRPRKLFATLQAAAPEGRVTWGFQAAFWAHNFGGSGKPAPLPQAIRTASERAFARIAEFARDRLALFESTKRQALHAATPEIEAAKRQGEAEAEGVVRAAKSAAEAHLASVRSRAVEIEKGASAARTRALEAKEGAEARAAEIARREKRLDERIRRELSDREGFFERGFADLSAALRKVLVPETVAKVERAYAVETEAHNARRKRQQEPAPPSSSFRP